MYVLCARNKKKQHFTGEWETIMFYIIKQRYILIIFVLHNQKKKKGIRYENACEWLSYEHVRIKET